MKLNPDLSSPDRVISEGKLLEIIPIIMDPGGQPMMLPPVVYQVPNFMLGYMDHHACAWPYQFHMNERIYIPGSRSSSQHALSFQVRIMEDQPGSVPATVATVDAAAVKLLMDAIIEANKPREIPTDDDA